MASSTVTNSKYLDYEGLSHLKTVLDNRYANKTDIPTSLKNPKSLTIQGNGTTLTNGVYDGSVEKTVNITPASIGADTKPFSTIRNFTLGTLIKTNIDYSVSQGDPFYIEIKGNTYMDAGSMFIQAQGYIYNNTIINYSVTSLGKVYPEQFIAINVDGKLCFWFPRISYWHGYSVKVTTGYDYSINCVTTVEDSSEPTGTKRVVLSEYYVINRGFDAATSGHTHSYLPLSGGIMTGTINSQSIIPKTNTYNLGSSSLKWKNVYATTFTGNLVGNATTADSASYAYNIATSNIVTTETINTLTDDTVSVVPNIPTSQIVNSGALRQFWVNVRNIIEDNEFVCASALTDLNTRLDNINTSINLSTPNTSTKYNILGSPSTSGEINTAYCTTSVYMQNNNLYATSDERLKDFKEDIEVDLEKLRKLPKKYFTWKGESMIDIGTSAQELLKLYPELVSYDEVNDVYAVDYVKLSVIALAAVDTLYDRLKSTEDRLKVIEDKLAKLS